MQEERPAPEDGPYINLRVATNAHSTLWVNGAQQAAPLQRVFGVATLRRVLAETVGEPEADDEHAEIAEDAHGGADFLVLGQEVPLGEEDGPVAFV